MNISLNCKISLSKKLRKLIGNKGQVTLTAELNDGKGDGSLIISSDDTITFDKDILGNETSIMLTPSKISEYVPDSGVHGVENIFSSMPEQEEEVLTTKLAVTTPPDDKKKELEQKKLAEKIAQNVQAVVHISSMEELMVKVAEAQKRASENPQTVDLKSITNVRERAAAMERLEISEGVGIPSFIANDAVANLSINDLGISINMGDSHDLSRLSYKRIASSADLRELIRAGMLHFISPNEALRRKAILLKKEVTQNRGLKAYSGPNAHEKAVDDFETSEDEVLEDINIPNKRRKPSAMVITEENMDDDVQDGDFVNLVGSLGENRQSDNASTGKRVSSHSLSDRNTRARPTQSNNMPKAPREHIAIKRV